MRGGGGSAFYVAFCRCRLDGMSGPFKVIQMADGDWLATTNEPVAVGVFAAGRELALERLRERVEYREEMAPKWAEEYEARVAARGEG
jgi:hypothetical protein